MPKPEIGYTRRQLAEMHHAVNPYFHAIMNLEHTSAELNNASFESLVTYCKRTSVFLDKLVETVDAYVPVALHAYYSSDETENLAGDVDDWLERLEQKQNTKKLIGDVTVRKLKAFIINDMQPRLKELGSQLTSMLSLIERKNMQALGSHRTHAAFEHLKANDIVRVYHGTDSTGMREMLKFGVDATKSHQRHYNQGRERGLYVTPDLRTAKTFGNWILEFDVKARDLYPTQRWGLGSQRKKDLGGLLDKYVGSFRPLVSFQMNETQEPQAMFIGYVPIRAVKHVLTYVYSDSSKVRTLSTEEAAAELLDKGEEVPKWEQNMSAEDIINTLCEEHTISREELLDAFTAYEDLDALVRDFRLPRKLGLRLKQCIEHKRKGKTMSLAAISRTLAEAGIRHVIIAADGHALKAADALNRLRKAVKVAGGAPHDFEEQVHNIKTLLNSIPDAEHDNPVPADLSDAYKDCLFIVQTVFPKPSIGQLSDHKQRHYYGHVAKARAELGFKAKKIATVKTMLEFVHGVSDTLTGTVERNDRAGELLAEIN